MDHMDTRTKQYPYQDLGFREEGWPAIGQGKEEEEDYVYQPQTGLGPEPMDKEVDEEMTGEDIGSEPSREQREGAFVIKHRNKWVLREKAYLRHKDEMDYADERKLALYGDRVNEVTSTGNLHAKGKNKQKFKKLVTIILRPMKLAKVKDKEV
jgi:hypothetical protein